MKEVNYEEDLDSIDFSSFKTFFYNKDMGEKYCDKVTGAHFDYLDTCIRLNLLEKK